MKPIKSGWYKYSKGDVERWYYLKKIGFTHSLMPDCLMFAMDAEDSKTGRNIDAIGYDDFVDCKWRGSFGKEQQKQWFDSV